MSRNQDAAAPPDLTLPDVPARQDEGATGQHDEGEFPSEEVISRVLRQAGLPDSSQDFHLEPIPRNAERRDYLTRRAFRVLAGGRAVCHLRVGKDLADLRSRTQAFSEACPEIACHPLFWLQSDGWDYHGTELFEGRDLETLVAEGRLKSPDALVHARKVVSALERTLLPSDAGAATEEAELFLARACASPIFSGLDQQFLRDVIFPFIRRGALAGPQRTRWTNGDFIARNVLVDEHGNVRLVDYEFAARTHFFAEDWWRWRSISVLPPEALELPEFHGIAADDPWLEAFFILRHAVLVHEINGVSVAVSGLRPQMDRLVALTAAAHSGFRASVFFQPLAPRGPRPSAGPAHEWAMAQLYWDAGAAFTEEHSKRRGYPQDEDATLCFMLRSVRGRLNLRLDPAEAPGMILISGICVRHTGGTPLLTLDGNTGWDVVRMGDGLLRLAGSQALNLVSLNDDPFFLLPEIAVGDSSCDLACEVRLRFSAKLTALPDLLRRSSFALADQLRQRDDKIARMQQSFSWRVTAPLRWLRRRFNDRRNQPDPPAPVQMR